MNKNKLLLVTHGNIGYSMIEVAKNIIGEDGDSDIYFISNEGLSTQQIAEKIKELTDSISDDNFLVITDFPGGSCFIASKKIASSSKRISTLSGLNISMLLSFLTKKNMYSGDKLAEIIKTDGGRAIVS